MVKTVLLYAAATVATCGLCRAAAVNGGDCFAQNASCVSANLISLIQTSQTHYISKSDVAPCPGEGDRYGDHKCSHDPTHRVCAQLLDKGGKTLSWGKGDFWKITHQPSWAADIRAQKGDSWCICMWAAAQLINATGCENVHLRCEATDVDYVLGKYTDGGQDLEPAHECLKKKCPGKAAALLTKRKALTAF